MQLTINEEPRALVERDFAAHAASGRAQVEAMRLGTATYKGVPIKFGYLPKYFTEEGFHRLKEDLEHTWRILVRVIERYLEDPAYRALFGFPRELEEMILQRGTGRTRGGRKSFRTGFPAVRSNCGLSGKRFFLSGVRGLQRGFSKGGMPGLCRGDPQAAL